MNDSFVPLVTANAKPKENGFVPLNPKSATATPVKNGAAVATAVAAPATTEPCTAKPTVTLQRNGDLITGIKVQCTCGQVIELACVY